MTERSRGLAPEVAGSRLRWPEGCSVELVEPQAIEFPVAMAFRSYAYYKKFRTLNMVPAIKLLSN